MVHHTKPGQRRKKWRTTKHTTTAKSRNHLKIVIPNKKTSYWARAAFVFKKTCNTIGLLIPTLTRIRKPRMHLMVPKKDNA